jgi:hypothetical protein
MEQSNKKYTFSAPAAEVKQPARWGGRPIYTMEDVRAAAPQDLVGASDEQLVMDFASTIGRDPYELGTLLGVSTGAKRGDFMAGLSSGIDQLQGLGYSALAGAADIFGADSARDYLNRQAEAQQYEAYFAGKPERERVEDIGGFGDAIDWVQYQIGKQVPIMAGLIGAQAIPGVGQAASATGLTRLAASAPSILGGGGLRAGADFAARRAALEQGRALGSSTLVGSALGFGDLYQASGEDGEYNPYAALAMALPYGAAEAVVPALINRGIRAPQELTGGLVTRMAKAAGTGAVGEAGTEAFQTTLTRGIDSTATAETAGSEYLNAVLAGGVVGGAFSSLGGIKSPAKAPEEQQKALVNELNEVDLAAPAAPVAPTTAVEQTAAQQGTPARSRKKPTVQPVDAAVAEIAPDFSSRTAYDIVASDPNNEAFIDLRRSANESSMAPKQAKALQTQVNKLQKEIASAKPEVAATETAKGKKFSEAAVKMSQTRLNKKFEAEQAERTEKLNALQQRLNNGVNVGQSKAKFKTLEEALRKIAIVDGNPVVREELAPEELAVIESIDADLFAAIQQQEAPTQVVGQEADLTAMNAPAEVEGSVMRQEELDVAIPEQDKAVSTEQQTTTAPTPVNTQAPTATRKAGKAPKQVETTDVLAMQQQNLDLGVETLWDADDIADLTAEIDNINKGKGRVAKAAKKAIDEDKTGGTLNAEVVSEPVSFGGKVTLPDGVIAGIAVAMRNPRDPEMVKPLAYQKGVAAVDEELTAQYSERMKSINTRLQAIATMYNSLQNAGSNVLTESKGRRGQPAPDKVRSYRALISDIRNELNNLLTGPEKLLGDNKQESLANLQAIISSIKTRNENKLTSGTVSLNGRGALDTAAARFGKKAGAFNRVVDYTKFLDTMVANLFTSYVSGKLTEAAMGTRVTGNPVRTSNAEAERGATQPLENALRGEITGDIIIPGSKDKKRAEQIISANVPKPEGTLPKGQVWRQRPYNNGALTDIIRRVADPAGTGTASPYARALAKAIITALDGAKDSGGPTISPAVVLFDKDSGESPRYEPNEGPHGTVYLSKNSSQEVVLHEAMHAATQWFIYSNPEHETVQNLLTSVDEIIEFADDGGIDNLPGMSRSYKDQARAVVDILRQKRDADKPLDAVAELVAYGTTLNSFMSMLKGIDTASTDQQVRTWLSIVDDAFKRIMVVVRDLLGMPNTMASKVLENSIMMLEFIAAREEDVPSQFFGNRLDNAIDARINKQTNENETYADGTYIDKLASDASERGQSLADSRLTTRYLFDFIGWSKLFGKELPDGSFEQGAFQKKVSEIADSIRENFPGVTRFTTLFNANFAVSAYKDLVASFKAFKQDRSRFFLHADRFVRHFEHMTPEKAQATINYLDDGNSTRLDAYDDAELIKEWADDAKATIIQLAQSLNKKEREFFIKQNETTGEWQLANRFSEVMLGISDKKAISSHKLGLGGIGQQIKAASEAYDEATFNDFVGELMQVDAEGNPILDDDFYRVVVDRKLAGYGDHVLFVSKSKYDMANGDITALTKGLGTGSFAKEVDTSVVYRYSGRRDDRHTFVRNKSLKDSLTARRQKEFALAMRNTFGGLSMHFASKNFVDNLSTADFTYDSVEALNADLGITDPEKMFTEDQLKASAEQIKRNWDVNWKARAPGSLFVMVPEAGWGDMGGKIVPGEVWVAINDMADRNPMGPSWYNNSLTAWKSSKTVWNLGTQLTNVLSNVTLMMFHGIPLRTALDAANLLVRYEISPMSLTKEQRDAVVAFEKSGAMLGNFANTEIKKVYADALAESLSPIKEDSTLNKVTGMMNLEQNLVKRLQQSGRTAKDKALWVHNGMVAAYNMGDNVFRFAAFLQRAGTLSKQRKEKTLSEQTMFDAGLYAKAAFIDYDIDAHGIKLARQTVMPFVSYTYGIVPVLARIVATKPWLIANTFATMALLDMAAAALAGDDDEEIRKLGPKDMEDRIFGFGPSTHIRLPFFGDSENPVYLRWGDYVPMASSVQGGMPNSFMGIESWPQGLSPSNPFFTLGMTMFGLDAYRGQSFFQPTNTGMENVQEVAKRVYSLAAPPMVSATTFEKGMDILNEKVGPTGDEKSAAMFLFGRFMGLKLVDYNLAEEAYFRDYRASKSNRDFRAAINKMRRDEYAKGYPDYEELDAKIMELYEDMRRAYNEIYKIEEE